MKAFSVLAAAALLALATATASRQETTSRTRPNIVFITSDDHRWDGLGAAGNPAVRTPHLDRLAGQGILFRQATTHVSQCMPSRATLLTGLAVHQHGALSHEYLHHHPVKPDAWSRLPTLPGLLRQAGYTTALVGKWHVTVDPWQSGFSDVRTWLPHGGTHYRNPELARGTSHETKTVKGYTQEIFADDALAFLRDAGAKKNPFLLWLAFTAPHTPLEPNPPDIQKLYAGKPVADLLPPGFPKDLQKMNDWRHYYEAVSFLDQQVGRVMEALDSTGLAQSTIVVFIGDNGFMMGQRGVGAEGPAGKVVPYEGSIRVPMILRAPALAGHAGASDLPVSSLDLPPTLLTVAGLQVPSSWPGRDLLPALRDPQSGPQDAFSAWADDEGRFGAEAFRMVRTPRHKLIVWKDRRKAELYDLLADPEEKVNLLEAPEARAVRQDLAARLEAWMKRTSDPALSWK